MEHASNSPKEESRKRRLAVLYIGQISGHGCVTVAFPQGVEINQEWK